jgi:protein arginine kinase activator
MKCEMCGCRDATVRYSEVADGRATTWHLCEACAGERGVGGSLTSFAGPLVDVLMGLLEGSVGEGPASGRPSCSACGLTYEEFRSGGRLGCARCYEAFASELGPLLRRIHGSSEHTGRVPSEVEGDHLRRRELGKLRARLAAAVRDEDYERAAELRDSILDAERSLEEGEAEVSGGVATGGGGEAGNE